MACKYTYQGKTYEAWEFVDVLAAMPAHELMKYLPEEAKQKMVIASGNQMRFVHDFLQELSFEDGAFRYPITKSKSLSENMSTALPGSEYLGEDTRPDERTESKADRRFVFAMPKNADGEQRIFYVFTKGDEVWIDVSRLTEGSRGSAVYHAVGNYAYNNGKVFVGDPNGLSEDAVIRRTSAMLSSALRFGTTEHLGASPEMIKGAPEKGIEPLDWRGSDLDKTTALIHTFVKTLQNLYPGIKNARYDFNTRQFIGANNLPIRRGDGAGGFNAAGNSPAGRASRAGEATLRRGILIQSLMAAEGGERPGILEDVLRGASHLVSKDGGGLNSLFSISFNPQDFRDRLERSDSLIANKMAHAMNNAFRLDTASTFNFWHKTVGSQFHKAQIDRNFGRVFNRAQQFIEDVARYGTKAADLAPGLLPKMDTFFGALREVKNSKRDAEDQKAIAAPIFDGTLYEDEDGNKGKVWRDDDLRDKYKLNERQIGLYRQFRSAVDKSLEDLAIAEMNKVARVNELELPGSPMSMNSLADFYSGQYADRLAALRKKYDERAKVYEANEWQMRENADNLKISRKQYHETMSALQSEYAAEQNAMNREIESLEKLDNAFKEKAATIFKLQREGYAPLMRFGKYTVDVVKMVPDLDESGQPKIDAETGEMAMKEDRIFFSMFETENEARDAERVMNEEYPDALVRRGVSSQDGWQLFGSVNPGSLEMLAELVGKEDEVLQTFYKEATASRSALKRLIHRKGTAGYSNDVTRSLASFLMSNARATASADHFGDIMEAAADIPKDKGDVKDEAVKLINYIRNPNEEAGTLRGMLFMQYLGGSIASAAVNLTQTLTTTLPFLSQYGINPADLVKSSALAAKRMAGKSLGVDTELGKALEMAEDEGVVSPHNIHNLMGASGVHGATGNKILRMASHVWGSFFGMAEQFNRETAFIAAFQLAQKMGDGGLRAAYRKQSELNASRGLPPPDSKHFSSPYAFAKNAVNETQFILSKAARPNWARGTVGATLFTFKQFSVMYLELFKRLPNKERAIMLGVLVLLAGVTGLPFSDDLDDLIDTLGQAMGYSTNTRKWKDELLVDTFGKTGADFISSGVSAFLPLELAGRLGMANLIPATGLLKKSNSGNHERDYAELMGAAGGYAKQLMDAWDYTLQGRYGMAAAQGFLPKGMKDLVKGYDMASNGTYDDTHGRMVTQVDGVDALVKALGFQPSKVADIQRLKGYQMQDIALVKTVKASISEIWATGIHNRDPERTALAREMVQEWNEKNPDSQIKIDKAAVQRRVKQMNMTAAERMEKVAPKEMRAGIRAAFSDG